MRALLTGGCPAIRQRAKAEDALILWGDEMGLRSDDAVGRSYAPRGRTPVVPAAGRRFACNMISAISNFGRLDAKRFVQFLGRLLGATGDPPSCS